MTKIGLLSDTHSYLDEQLFEVFKDCDELWHAGDIGSLEVIERLEKFKPLRAVYGNIDERAIQNCCSENLHFECEGMRVWITHIGGYPGKYPKKIRAELAQKPVDLFICGHSHILKIIPDTKYQLLHINPGACGQHGWHKVKTVVRFAIDKGKIQNLEVVELGARGRIV